MYKLNSLAIYVFRLRTKDAKSISVVQLFIILYQAFETLIFVYNLKES